MTPEVGRFPFWINMAWIFLTIGIALGPRWVYYEFGWGGWRPS